MAKVCLALLVVMTAAAAMALASPADVNIYNDMQGEEIQVNCKKGGGHEFGETTLLYGEHLGWGFTPSSWGTTKYSCTFRWGLRVANFYVWVDNGIIGTVSHRFCTHCLWTVQREGFFRNERGPKMFFIHAWR